MSNETKRDVLKRALNFFVATGLVRNINYGLERYQYLSEYDAALPDDLPVIPQAVSEYIKWGKEHGESLYSMIADYPAHLSYEVEQFVMDWMPDHSDTFARAWVLGVWRVEETGEIVKLEAEK